MITLCFLIVGIVASFIIIGFIWCYKKEKRDFNNGICPYCGNKLVHFDDDSQGGQGWRCNSCDYVAWISWFKGD